MYKDHFGLMAPLVGDGIARDDQIFRGPIQEAAETDLTLALSRGDSVAVVYGPAGVGKSTLAADSLRESVTQLAIGGLTTTPQSSQELLEQLLIEFDFTPYKMSRAERLTQWRQYLAEMSATETRVGIVVENADQMATEVLAELESLTSPDIRGTAGANLLLTARSSIAGLDTDPRLTALRQRCRAIVEVVPLDAASTADYLRFRFTQVGGDWDVIAAADLDQRIHDASGGVIRVIDNLVESCLARAAHSNQDRLTAELFERVAACLPGVLTRPSTDSAKADSEPPIASLAAPKDVPEDAPAMALNPHGAEAGAEADAEAEAELPIEMEHASPSADSATGSFDAAPQAPPDSVVAPAELIEVVDSAEFIDLLETSGTADERQSPGAGSIELAAPGHTAPEHVETEAITAEAPLDIPVLDDIVEFAHVGQDAEISADREVAAEALESIPTPTPLDPQTVSTFDLASASEESAIGTPDSNADDRESAQPSTTDESATDDDPDGPDLPADALDEHPGAPLHNADAEHGEDHSGEDESGKDEMTDEDRQQVEMLEAFTNAQALEEISEAMAETIFGDQFSLDSEFDTSPLSSPAEADEAVAALESTPDGNAAKSGSS